MREIKFRVWDKNKSKINYDITGFECSQNIIDGVFIDGEYFNLKNGVLMQYTGLKDKNGVEIYEGDICVGNGHIEKGDEKFIIKYGKYKTEEWQETYSCNTHQFGWYAEFIKSKSQVHLVIPNGIIVVGNIYEDLKESGE